MARSRRRIWFGRAFLIASALCVLAIVTWPYFMARHLDAVLLEQIAELQAAGEPILPQDFEAVAPADDPGNAATDIQAAIQLVDRDAPAVQTWNDLEDSIALPLRDDERAAMAGLVETLRPAMARLEPARDKPRMLLTIHIATPPLATLLPELNPLRELANGLGSAALLEHEQGDDSAAIRHLRDALLPARYAAKQPALVACLVGRGCVAVVCDTAGKIAPDLRIGAGGVSTAQVRALIDELMDDAAFDEQFRAGLRADRMVMLEELRLLASGMLPPQPGESPPSRLSVYIGRPMFLRNALALLEFDTVRVSLVNEPRLSRINAKIAANKPDDNVNAVASMLAHISDRAFSFNFQFRTDRHLAAAALALRWYALEHAGQLPATLSELVPEYLPEVPQDAFADPPAPLRYLPDAENPILYSVGNDGIDGGGDESPINPRSDIIREWERLDRVLHLTRQPRPPAETD